VPTLAALAGSPWRPALVITQPDRPQGRRLQLAPPPVKEAALALGLPVAQPEDVNDPAFLLQLRALAPDVILTAAYGGYLRRELRRLPRLGCLNLHPSLLPRHRGPAPVPYTSLPETK
jgi:methionyl-tRNA formyltransferase